MVKALLFKACQCYRSGTVAGLWLAVACGAATAEPSPYNAEVTEQERLLTAPEAGTRAGAAEALGYLRSRDAAAALAEALSDPSATVRREAALALGWCGGRAAVSRLLHMLDDHDWSVRQAAAVAVTNLTGMELPFDGLADAPVRHAQAEAWRQWWATVPAMGLPAAVDELLPPADTALPEDLAAGCPVTSSSTYKGPPGVLTAAGYDGFWQTKNVAFPQSCTVDLGKVRTVGSVVVQQYGRGFCVTRGALEASSDGTTFEEVWRTVGRTPPRLVIAFEPRPARYLRIFSHSSENPTYPTTFRRLHVFAASAPPADRESPEYALVRALRAAAVLGMQEDVGRVVAAIAPHLRIVPRDELTRTTVQTGLRCLGRLGGETACRTLVEFLGQPHWARYAADALGEIGSEAAAKALLDAYPRYARTVRRARPAAVPTDDRPGFEAVDRIYETPYMIAFALARVPDTVPINERLRQLAPLLLANLPGDFDGAMLYESEACHRVTAHLLERAGWRGPVRDLALQALGVTLPHPDGGLSETETATVSALARAAPGDAPYAASWLPALCRPEERSAALISLLEHDNGWVRINAAKTLGICGTVAARPALRRLLREAPPEASYGYFGRFLFRTKKQGQDEYKAPSPFWREAVVHALGRLGDAADVPLLAGVMNDDQNVLGVRYAAAAALDAIGTPAGIQALRQAAAGHPFHSIRLYAREGLWRRGLLPVDRPAVAGQPNSPSVREAADGLPSAEHSQWDGIVFIRGPNSMPNDFQIDIWRQTYSTTDSGPTYRLGTDLCLLKPPRPDGQVTRLTRFDDGYVADCEVSWDGRRVIFARRGGDDDPWWHICEIGIDGTGLRQLTDGPYHDVQPIYLPDGRIAFSSSRIGLRDEYHGYPATGLTVMDADGSNLHCVGFNLGRDNEPALLPDGRLLFSRLELFYSRLKTELTVQAIFPDGSHNVTLYGPERRSYWHQVTQHSKERWWGESGPRHRVLRLTQPQALGDGRVLCSTTAGLTAVGPGRLREEVLAPAGAKAFCSPFVADAHRVLCSATPRTFKRSAVDLGIYLLRLPEGSLTLLYNDPATAEFEARPVMRRQPPPVLAELPPATGFTGYLFCRSARYSRDEPVRQRGRLLRIIEGQPVVSRHHTHTSTAGQAWKNHVGTHARVLGTVPLAADGSFSVEVPADRLLHCQILDSDRRVVGNQLIWMSVRPGERRGCTGCHETPNTAPPPSESGFMQSARRQPLPCLPTGGEFSYRAKLWQKGQLPDEGEARTRTARAVNLLGRD